MKITKALPLGWILSLMFILGTIIFGGILESYNPVSQTVSEIGQEGSPLQLPWQMFATSIGFLIIVFAIAMIVFAKRNILLIWPAIFLLAYGLSQFGIGMFPAPHPLHNVFGLSMTIGYFAPLVFVLAWRNKLGKQFKELSWLAFVLIMLGIFLNLSPAFAPNLYPLEYYGVIQRFLLFTFYGYVAFVSYQMQRAVITARRVA